MKTFIFCQTHVIIIPLQKRFHEIALSNCNCIIKGAHIGCAGGACAPPLFLPCPGSQICLRVGLQSKLTPKNRGFLSALPWKSGPKYISRFFGVKSGSNSAPGARIFCFTLVKLTWVNFILVDFTRVKLNILAPRPHYWYLEGKYLSAFLTSIRW